MKKTLNRRNFVKLTAATALASAPARKIFAESIHPVRIGIIGLGGRGSSLLSTLLGIEGVVIPAVCDIKPERAALAQKLLTDAGRPQPEAYTQGETAFEALNVREDLDAVIIATPWNWHTPMAVSAMKAKKYVGVEVPAALTIPECWELIDTSEKYNVPCMMLENWSYRRDNLAVLKMIRAGLFGETVHAHCSYSHNCVASNYTPENKPTWRGEFMEQYNRDQYPTHGLGPVLSWMNINCGDSFDTLTSTASGSFGLNHYYQKKFGAGHPLAQKKMQQGDIVTTVIKTKKEKTIIINYDVQLPRPYDNQWMLQGTEGIYDHKHDAIYLAGSSPQEDQWEPFKPYQEKYDHAIWRDAPKSFIESGHGGCDSFVLAEFVKAVRQRIPTPIDVYDSVTFSCIVPLSGESIAKKSAPVQCPDFTKGKWKTNAPRFALEI